MRHAARMVLLLCVLLLCVLSLLAGVLLLRDWYHDHGPERRQAGRDALEQRGRSGQLRKP